MKKIYILILSLIISIIPIKTNASTLHLNKNEILLGIGVSETLKATISSDLNSSNIIWRSSNEKISLGCVIMKKLHTIIGVLIITLGSLLLSITVNNEAYRTIMYKVIGAFITFLGILYIYKICKMGKQSPSALTKTNMTSSSFTLLMISAF